MHIIQHNYHGGFIMERKGISRKNNLRKLVTGTLILVFCLTVLYGCKENQVHTPTDNEQTVVPTGTLTDTTTDNTTAKSWMLTN
jgi:hypothetical protein